MHRSKFPLVYKVDPTSPSLQSQHPHLRQSSCQYMSRALSKYLQRENGMILLFFYWSNMRFALEYLSWIFFPHPAHSWGPDVFWGSALTDIVMLLKREKKRELSYCTFSQCHSQWISFVMLLFQ